MLTGLRKNINNLILEIFIEKDDYKLINSNDYYNLEDKKDNSSIKLFKRYIDINFESIKKDLFKYKFQSNLNNNLGCYYVSISNIRKELVILEYQDGYIHINLNSYVSLDSYNENRNFYTSILPEDLIKVIANYCYYLLDISNINWNETKYFLNHFKLNHMDPLSVHELNKDLWWAYVYRTIFRCNINKLITIEDLANNYNYSKYHHSYNNYDKYKDITLFNFQYDTTLNLFNINIMNTLF